MKKIFLSLGILFPFIAHGAITPSAQCVNGRAAGYECENVHLLSRIDLSTQGVPGTTLGNDIWGWTDPETNREYVIMGLSNKASIVDVTNPREPIHLIDVPTATVASIWRDIKVYKDHAFIVSEAMNHGMQVFDLRKVRDLKDAPKETLPRVMQPVAHYTLFGSAHNIAINEDTGFAYAVGTTTCDAGLHVVDIRDPENPKFSTCVDRAIFEGVPKNPIRLMGAGDTYTHDVECVVYHGPDLRYTGREICVASNSDTVNIVDVTDKANPKQLSALLYPDFGFVHQGWLTGDQRYYLQGDELDEQEGHRNTRTHILDLGDLENPKYLGFFEYKTTATDHNIYIRDNRAYAANYASGLRVLDVSDIANAKLREVGYFDIIPEMQDDGDADMYGAWSVYPFFPSHTIAVSGMDKALYLLELDQSIR